MDHDNIVLSILGKFNDTGNDLLLPSLGRFAASMREAEIHRKPVTCPESVIDHPVTSIMLWKVDSCLSLPKMVIVIELMLFTIQQRTNGT